MIYSVLDKKSLDIAAHLFNDGKIVIYPTDTLYSFGVDATNCRAIQDLNNLKNRIQPYSIIVNSFNMLKKYAKIDEIFLKKIRLYLPGPYTVILKAKDNNLSKLINPNISTIGVRIPNNKFILEVVKKINKPIVTTSINKHKELPLNEVDIINTTYPHINFFADDKVEINSKGSTIIDCSSESFKILRKGDGEI